MDRDSLTKGAAIIAFLFALGMLCLLYFIWSERFGWALFWWLFVALAVPLSVNVVYRKIQKAYTGQKMYGNAMWLWTLSVFAILFAAALIG